MPDIYPSPLIVGKAVDEEDMERDDPAERNLPLASLMGEWTWGQVSLVTVIVYIRTSIFFKT